MKHPLKLCGLYFVYLPEVVHHYITTPKDMLNEVVGMLSPSLTKEAIFGLLMKIKLFKTDTFCIEQLHHKLGFKDLDDTAPALMFRISQSRVGNNVYTNFLRIELTPDVLKIVQDMTDTFLSYNGSDRIIVSNKRDEKGSFLYNGFYRQIFEILLLQKAVMCHLLIDFVHGTISFPEIDVTLTGLHRKEKALYTLFVYEAKNGGINFTAPESTKLFPRFNQRMEALQKRFARIYASFGGEEETAPDITKSEIRLPMISGIKKAITKQKEKIYDSDRFTVSRDKNGFYGISALKEAFQCRDFSDSGVMDIYESRLFQDLDKI